jgi:RNA polymerase sigma-70 factor (ECF subfamily)
VIAHTAPAPDDDEELLAAVARGDRQAFAALHRRHAPTLLGLLTRMLGSRSDGEDVLQEVFLQIWRKAGQFDPRRGSAFYWVVTLARSRALDRLGTLGSRVRLAAGRLRPEPVETVPDPADEVSLAEDARRVRNALAQIPEAQRQVLLLAYFGGRSQSEIAEQLGAPLGTVKSHARLGLTKLKNLLHAARLTRRSEPS